MLVFYSNSVLSASFWWFSTYSWNTHEKNVCLFFISLHRTPNSVLFLFFLLCFVNTLSVGAYPLQMVYKYAQTVRCFACMFYIKRLISIRIKTVLLLHTYTTHTHIRARKTRVRLRSHSSIKLYCSIHTQPYALLSCKTSINIGFVCVHRNEIDWCVKRVKKNTNIKWS